MRYTSKLIAVLIVGVFAYAGNVFAQNIPPSQQRINQNQQPPSRTVRDQTKPQAEQPQEVSPEQNIIPEQKIAPETVAVETTSSSAGEVRAQKPPVSYLVYAAIVIVAFFGLEEWLRKWRKHKKKPALPAEAEKIVCETCGGSGKIKKKRKVTVPCGHCKESGIDICHHCSGTGRDGLGYGVPLEDIENYPKCLYCSGKGTPELVAPCCMCKGKRKEEFDESYEAPCPTCKGSGWIRNW